MSDIIVSPAINLINSLLVQARVFTKANDIYPSTSIIPEFIIEKFLREVSDESMYMDYYSEEELFQYSAPTVSKYILDKVCEKEFLHPEDISSIEVDWMLEFGVTGLPQYIAGYEIRQTRS